MKILRSLCLALCMALSSWVSLAAAKPLPPEVTEPYKAYNSSLAQKDYKAALKHGKKAWQEAEKRLGDSKTTSALAFNYGNLAMKMGDFKSAIEPLTRSADLAHLEGEGAPLIRAEREVELIGALINTKDYAEAKNRLTEVEQHNIDNDIADSIFAGELLVHRARLSHIVANRSAKRAPATLGSRTGIGTADRTVRLQSKSSVYAQKALDIFDKHPAQTQLSYKALAYQYIGFSHEREKEWLEAALAYQEAMLIRKTYSDLENPGYAIILGRWMNARSHVYRAGRSNRAVAKNRKDDKAGEWDTLADLGICKCWPYENESAVRAEAIKRVAPTMPSRATTSGFSIVQFDLSDEGDVINLEMVHSWPVKMYDRSSLRAVKQWKYEPKSDGVEGAQREGIVATVHYYLQTRNGDPI